jgi:adenosylcobinamide-phosphate synthase
MRTARRSSPSIVAMLGDASLALAVLAMEACIGYPRTLFAAIGHPVSWIGWLLHGLELRWNRPRFAPGTRRALGVLAVILVVGLAGCAGFLITRVAMPLGLVGSALLVAVATSGLAQRSLYQHVRAVETALLTRDLESARTAVARIVGRDTASLSAADVSSAAIESLAESFNDAVVAPAFWLIVGGLPALFAYKAANTADSMIGHIEPRWRAFGWAAARLDDAANFVPARIAGALIALAGTRGFRVMWRDAPKHASPNAGWPEAAVAGALELRLGGDACYDGAHHARPHFGDGATPRIEDLGRALTLYKRACAALWIVIALIAFVPLVRRGA